MALINKIKAIADAIRERTGITGKMSLDEMAETISYMDVGSDDTQTYILVDENGVEYPAVLVDEEVTLTATTNDIRIGTTAVTEEGVVTGEKEIPAYHVSEGYKLITNGNPFVLTNTHYDYSKLQAVFCKFNSSLNNSVYTEQVAINDSVYNVLSIDELAVVTKDTENARIDFGFTNDSGTNYIIRYFMYREVY